MRDETAPGVLAFEKKVAAENRQARRRLRAILPLHVRADLERQAKPTGCLSRGMPNRRIIEEFVVGDVKHQFHATKGPRSFRVPA